DETPEKVVSHRSTSRRLLGHGGRVAALSRLPVPVRDLPEIVIPAALMHHHAVLQPYRVATIDLRQNIMVGDDEVVELDEQRRPFDGIELALGLVIDLVIVLVLPARDVASLPLVLLARQFPGRELVHEK